MRYSMKKKNIFFFQLLYGIATHTRIQYLCYFDMLLPLDGWEQSGTRHTASYILRLADGAVGKTKPTCTEVACGTCLKPVECLKEI